MNSNKQAKSNYNKSNKTNYNKSNKINYNNKTYNYYKKQGHLESNCYTKQNKLKSINTIKKETILCATTSNIFNTTITSNNNLSFTLDSSASIHTSYLRELFIPSTLKESNTSIKQGNTNKVIKASAIGDIELLVTSTKKVIKLKNILYIPKLGVNLLSLNLIASKGYKISFNKYNTL